MAKRKSIASLGVTLVARTSTFKKRMMAAKALTKRFSTSILSGAKSLVKMSTAIGAVGAAISVALIKKQFDAIDTLAKVAGSLSISTKKLAGYRLAADLAGVSTEMLDKSLQVMSKNIGEAAGGTGEAVDALEALGLNVAEFAKLDAGTQFEQVMRGLGGVALQSRRASIASDLFGRSGVKLLNIVKGGSAAMEEAAKDANQFGLAISDLAARQVENANDAFTRLRSVMTGVFRQAAALVAPFAEAFANHFVDMARSGESMELRMLKVFKGVTLGAAEMISSVSGFVHDMKILALTTIDQIGRVSETIGLVTGDITSGQVKHQRGRRQARLDAAIVSGSDIRNAMNPERISARFDRIIGESAARAFWSRFNDNQGTSGKPVFTSNPDVVEAIKTLGNTLRLDVLGGGVAL